MDVRYARSGGIDIAYRTLGDGPLTLVLVAGAFTNLEPTMSAASGAEGIPGDWRLYAVV